MFRNYLMRTVSTQPIHAAAGRLYVVKQEALQLRQKSQPSAEDVDAMGLAAGT